ncbi:putative acyl-CoA thioester hydrolase [Uliginosibacterium flavum]|uniref:Pectinesterase family protein n=1 Tax=Uliginosibacterium flavum TaxID=1396831 RepID=A0ABV2TGI4_9RHOO
MKTYQKTLSLAVVSAVMLGGCATSLEGPIATSTAKRPQLSVDQAAGHTMAAYFAKSGNIEALVADPWDPVTNGIGDVAKLKPTFTVAADGSGTHKSVQAAIDAVAKGGTDRVYILVKPGVYREQVCMKDTAPVTIYGTDSDPTKVVIVNNIGAGSKKDKEVTANACEGRKGADTYGTSGSTTFLAYADGFQAKNLTVSNDYDESVSPKSGTQAVALNTRGDKVILENVRLLGNQDTLMMKSLNVGAIARAYVTNSYIEGDVDFVFSRALAVFDKVEFKSLTTREGSEGGFVFAPSHPQIYNYGFLVTNSKFTSDANKDGKKISLGRAWDDSGGVFVAKDGSKSLPNGMLVIRSSYIGAHIDAESPWNKAASTNRPFDSEKAQTVKFGKEDATFPANRLFEFRNSGPGAAGK